MNFNCKNNRLKLIYIDQKSNVMPYAATSKRQSEKTELNRLALCSPIYHILSLFRNGILLPKLFWPTVRKNCSSDREKLL